MMKTFLPISYMALVFATGSCQQKPKPEKPATNVPVVLEGKHVDVSSILSKRNTPDLMESIYKELMEQSEELKKLDQAIGSMEGQYNKALDSFSVYNRQNGNYYNAANNGAAQISDSVLRQKVQALIGQSLKQYNASVMPQRTLDSLINRKKATVRDLYVLLKVVKTLPAIHAYQQERMPGKEGAVKLNKQLDSLVHTFDSLHLHLK